MRKSGAGGSGPDSPSAAWLHVDSFVPDLGRPSWARGGGGGSVLPGPFKSPRPEEQCAPFPTPGPGAVRLLPRPSFFVVRPPGVCLARPTRGQSLGPGPLVAGGGAGRGRVCAAAGDWPFKNCPRRQRNVTNPTFDSQHSKRRGRAPGGRGARGGAPGGSGKQ